MEKENTGVKQRGKITVPTEVGLVDETLKIIDLWGADAVRDCDGVAIPDEILKSGQKIYSTYFPSRGDNGWARKVPNEKLKIFLMSERVTADSGKIKIPVMQGYLAEQFAPFAEDCKKYWQVINRTTAQILPVDSWNYDDNTRQVTISGAATHCEYTVNFLADQIWDSTQMYNYITNDWNREKDLPFNAYCPETSQYVVEAMRDWIKNHPDTDVVRFTTFFYHFTLVFNNLRKEKFVDWFGYGASVSPQLLDAFEKKFGYRLTAEDFVDEGYYNTSFRVPSAPYRDYMTLLQEFVSAKAKQLVGEVHAAGKEAMMFLGDNWIGTEPYGDSFKDIGIDAVVGSVGGGTTLRMISDIPGIKYSEGRFLPYFFPDTFYEGNDPVPELNQNWLSARRAIMRNPVDRIGYGGYLSLALKFPDFVARVGEICDEFRGIHSCVKGGKPHSKLTVAVLNSWGKLRTWQTHMVAHALWYKQIYSYLGICESLSGLAFDVKFISFDDCMDGVPRGIDVIINAGMAGDAFSGGNVWRSPELVRAIRKWISGGGGFVGVGEPSAVNFGGRFIQLADALGVDKEQGFSLSTDKYNVKAIDNHFITDGLEITDLGEPCPNIYAQTAQILRIKNGDVQLAVNAYGKGRCCYISGLPYSPENSNLLLRACLYAADKESELKKWYCSNVNCECSYYTARGTAAVINNTMLLQTTDFYNGKGECTRLTLQPCEIMWIKS